MSAEHDALKAGLDAVTALLTVVAGTTKRKDHGQMSRVVDGRRHLWSCNSGMWHDMLVARATRQRRRQHFSRRSLLCIKLSPSPLQRLENCACDAPVFRF